MTFEALGNVIRAKFLNDVTTPLSLITFHDNQEDDKPSYPDERWVRVNVLTGTSRQVSFGSTNRFRTPGTLVIQIFLPIGRGTKDIDVVVDRIVTEFRAKTEGGVTYQTPQRIPQGRDGTFYQVNVNIPFYSDDVEVS